MTIWQLTRRASDHALAQRELERRQTRRRPSSDRGVTLVEIVVAITLIALVAVPILVATSTMIRSARVNEEAAEVETILVNAADRVNRAERTGEFRCDMSSPVRAAIETAGWPTSSVTVVQKYRDSAGTWVLGAPGTPGCPATGFDNTLVQLIEITVTGPDEGISRTIEVVKSDF